MKQLLLGLTLLASMSSFASNCDVSINLGFGLVQSSSTTIEVSKLLEKKGYAVNSQEKGQYVSINVFGEEQLHNSEDPKLAKMIDDLFSTKGGYSLEHNIGEAVTKIEKNYKLRRYANEQNINSSMLKQLEKTLPDCK